MQAHFPKEKCLLDHHDWAFQHIDQHYGYAEILYWAYTFAIESGHA